MTIAEIRNLFSEDTEFYLEMFDDDDMMGQGAYHFFKINNVLFGTSAFADMRVNRIRATGKSKIIIESDMPTVVFNAWEKWADV